MASLLGLLIQLRGVTPAVFESQFREKIGPLVLRLALGVVCVYHGFAKIQANGGTNWAPDLNVLWQLTIAWGEFSAGMAILVGLYCRWAAAAALLLSVGTLIWFQGARLLSQPIASLESRFLVVLCSVALLCLGGGAWAVSAPSGGRPIRKKSS
jgi:uncharacterized membrane protein YphA (DoxX/SURF4 family)